MQVQQTPVLLGWTEMGLQNLICLLFQRLVSHQTLFSDTKCFNNKQDNKPVWWPDLSSWHALGLDNTCHVLILIHHLQTSMSMTVSLLLFL